jgi:hypothetical protein
LKEFQRESIAVQRPYTRTKTAIDFVMFIFGLGQISGPAGAAIVLRGFLRKPRTA